MSRYKSPAFKPLHESLPTLAVLLLMGRRPWQTRDVKLTRLRITIDKLDPDKRAELLALVGIFRE